MVNTGVPGSVCHIFPLPDLPFEADIRQPEVLHAKDPVRALECGVQLSALIHVAGDKFRAQGFQFLGGWLVHITG